MNIMPVEKGDILAGKYRVERVLGVGGMGVVVAARHMELLELRAIKFMLPEALHDVDAMERFVREARAAARLKSEHVAKVHDVGRLENGAPFMVMEYLEGEALDAILRERGPLPVAVAALYAIQVCKGLAEAHALGIIHRDLKPSNLFLTRRPDGTECIKVLDFGISKIAGADHELEMTKTNAMLGSPHYMSPEQVRSARTVDARTDIWSLGIILYRLTTGKLPFQGQSATELIANVLETDVSPPSWQRSDLSPDFDAVVLCCLQRNREGRFPNVAELAAALTPFAPTFAEAPIESMSRILSVPAPIYTTGAFAASPSPPGSERTPGTNSGLSARTPMPASSPTPPTFSPRVPVPPFFDGASGPRAPAEPVLRAEHTGGAWGNTSSGGGVRAKLPLLLLGGALTILLAVGAVFLLRPSADRAPPDQGAIPAASGEAISPGTPAPIVLPAASSSVVLPVSPPEPSGEPSAVVSSEPAVAPVARPLGSSARGPSGGFGKPLSTARPSASGKSGSDPFGTGRK